MPFIDNKISIPVSDEKKEVIKAALGQYAMTIGKPEQWLMVGIDDDYDLWFAGEKLEKGAYVSVSLLGNAPSAQYEKLTGQICKLYEDELGIPGEKVYVSYNPVNDWGWNGANF